MFEAATGHRGSYTVNDGGDVVTTKPLRIVQLPFGPALLTQEKVEDAGHAQAGAIGVYYFREEADKPVITGRWPRAVVGWDWGSPPAWHLTDRFTSYPAIYAWGDYMAQGIIGEGATLTELRPDGPATSDVIGTRYDDENGRIQDEDPICIVSGRIAKIRKDRFFTVEVTGSVKTVDRYVKRNGRFVAVNRIRWDIPCGYYTPAES